MTHGVVTGPRKEGVSVTGAMPSAVLTKARETVTTQNECEPPRFSIEYVC